MIGKDGTPYVLDFGIARGGGWDHYARVCRSALRYGYLPGYRDDGLGFRLVCSLP